MRIAVVGAGAMGSVFGAKLALAGHDVTLLDVREEHLALIRERGLELRDPTGPSRYVALRATSDPGTITGMDVLLFLCKGFVTLDAASGVRQGLGPDGWAVTLQNGLGNEQALAEIFGPERAVPGTTTVGAAQEQDGTTSMSTGTALGEAKTFLAPPISGGPVPAGVTDFAEALSAAGLPTEASPDATRMIWSKFVLAATMAPLTAVLRCTVQDVVDDEDAATLWEELFREITAVAGAEGVALNVDALREEAMATYHSIGRHTTSMAADIVAGRRTEIDSLSLEVARRGVKHGIDTPVSSMLGRLIRTLERTSELS